MEGGGCVEGGGRVCEGVIEMFLMEFSSLKSRVEVKE